MDNKKGFLFIGDILEVSFNNEYEIIPGHVLKKANSEQIKWIKKSIPETNNTKLSFCNRYELEMIEDGGNSSKLINIEEDKWKYWIIEYDEFQANYNIEVSLLLLKADIHILFQNVSSAIVCNPVSLHNFLSENKMIFKNKIICEDDLHEVKKIYTLIEDFKNTKKDTYPYIHKALSDFINLRQIPRRTSFVIVVIFSILESLLTHNPQAGDRGITHQLKTKLNLINNRFDEKINFRLYFGGPNTNTFELIIDKLYSYRSDIAHGDFTCFNRELSAIVGHEEAYNFLYLLLKKTIVQALKEPQLISDLKHC